VEPCGWEDFVLNSARSKIRNRKDGEVSTRREGTMTRAIGLRKGVSPSTGLQNIVLQRFIGFVSGESPEGQVRTMSSGREKEKEKARDVEVRPV